MQRLTKNIAGRLILYVGQHRQNETGDISDKIPPEGLREILRRLSEYEDTGVEPKELAALHRQQMADALHGKGVHT